MPIRADLRHFYGREWRTVTRPRILARAGNKCEKCGVLNYLEVERIRGLWLEVGVTWELGLYRRWRTEYGADWRGPVGVTDPNGKIRTVRIVLTVAHLNHTAGDDRDENLNALCQWCHLNHDLDHHHQTRAIRKDLARPLLNSSAEPLVAECL